jgi:dTDP-4-dehydrorhamnose reductase
MSLNERNCERLNSKVIILGSSGMLGQEVVKVFTEQKLPYIEFSRKPGSNYFFDFNDQTVDDISQLLSVSEGSYLINCIGWIPQRGSGDSALDKENAWKLNVRFPKILEELAEKKSLRVLQVATDCVFDGLRGRYLESDAPNSSELYGLSKIEGEAAQPSAMRVRCSIIGQDRNSEAGLFSWYKSQPVDHSVIGYANHFWNGVTTTALARLFSGIIRNDDFVSGLQHWVPLDTVSKFELLKSFKQVLGGNSAAVLEGNGPRSVDRTLSTNKLSVSNRYWSLAGYSNPPSVYSLVEELVD